MIKYEILCGIDVEILNFFHKNVTLIRIIKLIFLIEKLDFKSLKRNIGDMVKK
jgi:hypothetical protein